ncbi:MAG TPA: aspartate aminotransferase family protein [Anaeromyxobacteraceae bacterium]|jgi:4-aminobutyrate aminotransferase-like enzyme|nr:aspartate aminotransferase family protein [Anaeromyxobacteraceae bacterium]
MKKIQLRTEIPGPRSREVVAEEQRHLSPGLQGFALWAGVAMAKGAGSTLTDVDGNVYVDLIGGIGVNALGHCHPKYVAALSRQAETLTVGSFTSEPRAKLVNEVCAMAPPGLDRLQLYSGGAEAVESALRLARQHTGRPEVVSFWGGFHGKTAGAAALLGTPARAGLGPLPASATQIPFADCYRCPFQLERASCGLACAEFARKAIKAQPAGPVAAVIMEPMQGTAGNVIPPPEFTAAVAEAAHEVGALFIADEMICGFGRTGKPWGVSHSGARPDIVTLGKGFGSGFPVAGVLTTSAISQAKPWSNPSGASSSYGGNPFAAAAALASVSTIREEKLWENAERVGAELVAEFGRMQERHPFIGKVEGAGLFIGVELVKDRKSKEPLDGKLMQQVYRDCVRKGLLAMSYSPHLRLQPALTIDAATALEGLAVLDEVFAELNRSGAWR